VDWLVVGLGNPGDRYAGTRHNVGFEVGALAAERWDLPRAKKKYAGLYSEGGIAPGGPRVALLLPQTYMNEAGSSVGPARGALKLDLDRVVVVHDEIDLPFGRIEARLGGGLAGHNGLKSVKEGLGSPDFRRVRVGVGRPDSTAPEVVSSYVLSRFREPKEEVWELKDRAANELERLLTS
jgi:peptidyl-tRNA hydrolase, PTH1 family